MMSLKYKVFGAGCSLMAALALGACSDWDDHYDADTSLLPSQQVSLWKTINDNGELTQFAKLLERVGYDKTLGEAQSYTIWAPKDNTAGYDFSALSALNDSVLLNEFVKNHISRSNTLASGQVTDQRVFMLNKKVMYLNGNGSYKIQDISLSTPNIATGNGTIHLLDGMIPFTPNIYETLDTANQQIDSIATYFIKYHKYEIDKSQSIAGPAMNGELTYIDTVYAEGNSLYSLFNAYINREDSSYTMILPTTTAWNEAKDSIKKYFNYVPKFQVLESVQTTTGQKDSTYYVTLRDPEQLRDSMVNRMMVQDLFYNNNLYDNKKLKSLQTGELPQCDSLISTHRKSGEYDVKIYKEDAQELFKGATRIDRSNGAVWLTDHLGIRPWTSWNPEIRIEAETGNAVLKSQYCTFETPTIALGTQNPAVKGHVSNNSYLVASPQYAGAHPDIYFNLPDIRSTEYCIYVVTVPANITSVLAPDTLPYHLQVEVNYAQESGSRKNESLGNAFYSNPAAIDTIYLGNVTFPVAYYGTGDYKPFMRIRSRVMGKEKVDEELRIDCIILRPKALDDYLKANPDYKYNRGTY